MPVSRGQAPDADGGTEETKDAGRGSCLTTWRVLVGDVRERLAELPAASVQCVVTSPPFWGLRQYLFDGAVMLRGDLDAETRQRVIDELRHRGEKYCTGVAGVIYSIADIPEDLREYFRPAPQIGLEASPEAYVSSLREVFGEVWRVLRDDGTAWINLGDSYAANSWYQVPDSKHVDVGNSKGSVVPIGLKPKDLVGIPWRVAIALQADGWYLRSDIIWSKPNPMPESVTDRCTKSHEYIFMLTKGARYFYDAEAIKEASEYPEDDRKARSDIFAKRMPTGMIAGVRPGSGVYAFRNKRSVWTVATQSYEGAHFATFPEALIEPCILAGSSEKGQCPQCGAAWVRVVERESEDTDRPARGKALTSPRNDGSPWNENRGRGFMPVTSNTLRWQPSCTCDAGDPVPQTILDPFCGSGTTGVVAIRHQRNFVGVELNPAYVQLARKRIGNEAPLLAWEGEDTA